MRCGAAATALLGAARPDDGAVELLVAPMVRGTRELIAGLVRDPQFGPCVMLGVGGVLTEALGDVAFRRVPLRDIDARRADRRSLDPEAARRVPRRARGRPRRVAPGPCSACRGSPPNAPTWPRSTSTRSSSSTASRSPSTPSSSSPHPRTGVTGRARSPARDAGSGFGPRGLPALFEPRGVIVAGASSHPGKFGFVALHNILAAGYTGKVGATNLEGTPVLVDRHGRQHRRPSRRALGPRVRVHAGRRQPRSAARVRAAGRRAPRSSRARDTARPEPTAGAPSTSSSRSRDELGILLAGPNGQGVVSTPVHAVRADRRARPARGPDRDREPVRQLRLVVRELGDANRRRGEPGGERGQRRGRRDRRLPRLVRRRRSDRGEPRVRRGRLRRQRALRVAGRGRRRRSRSCS